MESIEEEFKLVCLHHIVAVNYEFALDQRKFFEDEYHQKLVLIVLAHYIVVVYFLKFGDNSLIFVKLDNQSFFFTHKRFLDLIVIFLLRLIHVI